jgi:hypothetical protein
MRAFSLLALLMLGGCIPRGHEPPQNERPPVVPGPRAEQASLQCHLDLARENIAFRVLPDRHFENGCSALGAVQLTDIGTPTANLGAMTCPLARQYARWVREAVQPAASRILGTSVTRIDTFGTYSCRPVNNRPGARLSEHGLANAVDVSGFRLGNGHIVTVVEGWTGTDERIRRFLREVHREGCERFSVGLGPDADALHYNHLHFDLGRSGTCR